MKEDLGKKMNRKLIIVRHGKSSWDTVVDDIDRPLNERGVNNAYEMAGRLVKSGDVPQAIFTSPANRALHTAMIMAREWELNTENIYINRNLYLAEVDEIYETIYEIPDHFTCVALYGHNPGFTHFVNHLTKCNLDNLPTAGVAVISLDLEKWNEISNAKVTNYVIDYPKKPRS